MGKNDFLSPKGIANASKSKGLQKLRFFCQVCAKQCRDQNGFKCHTTSEAHLRQMELFGANQGRFIDGFSEEFLKEFLSLMAVSHRNSRVSASVVYNEFISNKTHTHMNSTKWTSLTEFIKYLGRAGIASIDETPKGWFLTYVPEDREEAMRQQSHKRKVRAAEDSTVRDARLIEEQIQRANTSVDASARTAAAATELTRSADDGKASFGFGGNAAKRGKPTAGVPVANAFGEDDDETSTGNGTEKTKKPASAIEEIMRRGVEAERRAQKEHAQSNAPGSKIASQKATDDDSPWLVTNIVVKIVSKALRDRPLLWKKKAVVRKLRDGGFAGEVALLDNGETVIKIDQNDLQTVLPKVGGHVVVVKGALRGMTGVLKKLDLDNFVAVVTLDSGGTAENATRRFEYEDICKLNTVR